MLNITIPVPPVPPVPILKKCCGARILMSGVKKKQRWFNVTTIPFTMPRYGYRSMYSRPKGISRKRRRSRSAAPWYVRKYSVGDLARYAYSGVKRLKRLVNVEQKKADTNIGLTPTDAKTDTTYVSHLTAIAQGDTDQTRSGNSIKPLSLYVQGFVSKHASATATTVRMLIVRDKMQTADSIPGTGTIIDSDAGYQINAPLNNETVGRFDILKDVKILVDSQTPKRLFKYFITLDGHIRYNGATSGDIQKNGLFCCLVSDEATNTPTVAYTSRLTFADN